MARKTKDQKRIEELEKALRDLLDATAYYMYTPEPVKQRAYDALHK